MILFWSSGRSSFGKEYPNPKNKSILTIVKTFTSDDDEDNTQKTFNPFLSAIMFSLILKSLQS
ncbi:hypothetical protein [Flammeovirga sp. EKP202]|uniref:hypothetical protein n=1 Tax=Flammeovirga sp. EKP202 TaxID=2770592 RepID=UPI00165EEC8C|nr:hypothetical protein [Flammeovirga sp. EKP202]MBD0403713.1 hypothetical protein [Flammeovirga sp. EKP202]